MNLQIKVIKIKANLKIISLMKSKYKIVIVYMSLILILKASQKILALIKETIQLIKYKALNSKYSKRTELIILKVLFQTLIHFRILNEIYNRMIFDWINKDNL